MKSFNLLLLLTIPFCFSLHAQVSTKFYYNKHWELTTVDSALYIRMCVYDTTNASFAGPVIDIFKNGKPLMRGYYVAKKKEGDFTTYFENGQVESTGKFIDNKRSGRWTYYFSNGQERLVTDFTANNNRKIISLKDSTGTSLVTDGNGSYYETYEIYRVPGKVIITGTLKGYRKHDVWDCYLSTGTKLYSDKYHKGEFSRSIVYPDGKTTEKSDIVHDNVLEEPYKFFITEQFVAAKDVEFADYPTLRFLQYNGTVKRNARYSSGSSKTNADGEFIAEVSPTPKEGMSQMYFFIGEIIRYPATARRKGLQGKVMVEFIVEVDGSVTGFRLFQGLGSGLDEEALRVMTEYGKKYKWNPGTQQGKAVRTKMVVPIIFRLG